ncbi:MAG: AraC family transcriptional regulator ligand-binding domain-containing protein [Pseudomonadota bacterium]
MNTYRAVEAEAIRSMLSGALRNGDSWERLIEAVGIKPSLLGEEAATLDPRHVGQLLRSLAHHLQDESLGFLSRPTPPGTLALCFHLTVSCSTLREAIGRVSRLMAAMGDECALTLSEQASEAKISLTYSNPHRLESVGFTTILLLILHRWAGWATGKTLVLDHVNFADPRPSYDASTELVFSCRNYWNRAENSLAFSRHYLDLPVVKSDGDSRNVLPQFADSLVYKATSEPSLSASIQRILLAAESASDITLRDVAERLNMGDHSIRRRLREEGNSFSQIKESVRRDTAIYHLTCTETPVQNIAYIVGFSEPSAFNRAFKVWTGETPGRYRETHRST